MGKPVKVYVIKSKAGNFDLIAHTKHILNTNFNCEVLEFQGGEYTTEKLDQADVVLIVPPHFIEDEWISVGRGQFEEYSRACRNGQKIFMVTTNLTNPILGIKIASIDASELSQESWKSSWGDLLVDEDDIPDDITAKILGGLQGVCEKPKQVSTNLLLLRGRRRYASI